jgi:hypothetical protein
MTMKSAIFAIALLSGTAALAQTDVAQPPADPAMTTMTSAATGQTAMPGNAAPERDARGIAVISDAATVPTGYNGTPAPLNGTGGPLVDPADTAATGEPAATPDATYPACSRTVTDNCVQTYERRRHR